MKNSNIPAEARRFKEIREDKGLTQSEFASILEVKNTTADIERGKTKLSGHIVTHLMRLYQVNPLWLYGYSKQKYIKTDQAEISPKVVLVDHQENENMVLVNQKAAAGYPNNIADLEWYQKLPAFDIPLPEYRNATYRGFQVEGDSMLPNFQPNDWVLGKGLESLSNVSVNKVYVIVLQEAVVLKKIQKLPDLSKILLVSYNPEYAPYEVNIQDIQEIWQVNSKLTFHLEEGNESNLLKELQASMLALKTQLKKFNA